MIAPSVASYFLKEYFTAMSNCTSKTGQNFCGITRLPTPTISPYERKPFIIALREGSRVARTQTRCRRNYIVSLQKQLFVIRSPQVWSRSSRLRVKNWPRSDQHFKKKSILKKLYILSLAIQRKAQSHSSNTQKPRNLCKICALLTIPEVLPNRDFSDVTLVSEDLVRFEGDHWWNSMEAF